jgi:hypothetical protein
MRALLIIMFLLALVGIGQGQTLPRDIIDSLVSVIDEDAALQNEVFIVPYPKGVQNEMRYKYWVIGSDVVKIVRNFTLLRDSVQQEYYFDYGKLIYSREKIDSYYGSGTLDFSTWNGRFYFLNDKLIDRFTHGHGKSELDEWNAELEVLSGCADARKDVTKYGKR